MTTETVINFGRKRRTDPSIVARSTSANHAAGRQASVQSFVKVHNHDNAGLHRDAVERDVADPHRNREVVAEHPLQDCSPVIAKTTESMTIDASAAEWKVMYSSIKMTKNTIGSSSVRGTPFGALTSTCSIAPRFWRKSGA